MTFNKSNIKQNVCKKSAEKQIFESCDDPILHKLSKFNHSPLRYRRIRHISSKKQQSNTKYLKHKFITEIEHQQFQEKQEVPSENTPRLLKHYLFKNKQQAKQSSTLKNKQKISSQQLSQLKSIVQKYNRHQRSKTFTKEPERQTINYQHPEIKILQDQQISRDKSLLLPRISKIKPCRPKIISHRRQRMLLNMNEKKQNSPQNLSQLLKNQRSQPAKHGEIQQEEECLMQGWTNSNQITDNQNPSLDLYILISKHKHFQRKSYKLSKK